jgi:hypothetical protein
MGVWDGDYTNESQEIVSRLADRIAALQQQLYEARSRAEKREERLGITSRGVVRFSDGQIVSEETQAIPISDRDKQYDRIDSLEADVQLRDERIAELKARWQGLLKHKKNLSGQCECHGEGECVFCHAAYAVVAILDAEETVRMDDFISRATAMKAVKAQLLVTKSSDSPERISVVSAWNSALCMAENILCGLRPTK